MYVVHERCVCVFFFFVFLLVMLRKDVPLCPENSDRGQPEIIHAAKSPHRRVTVVLELKEKKRTQPKTGLKVSDLDSYLN